MSWNFNNDKPIYNQIIDQLIIKIINNTYNLGSKCPSVRELALEAKVNPNTMQKALAELEEMKLLKAQRTSGRFVTEDKLLIENLKKEIARKNTELYFENMKKFGYSKEEVLKFIKEEK